MHGGVIHRAPGCGWRLDHILAGEDHHALAGLRAFAMASVVADAAAIAPAPRSLPSASPGVPLSRWPAEEVEPCASAQRRLPSRIMPRCRGRRSGGMCEASSRSYTR